MVGDIRCGTALTPLLDRGSTSARTRASCRYYITTHYHCKGGSVLHLSYNLVGCSRPWFQQGSRASLRLHERSDFTRLTPFPPHATAYGADACTPLRASGPTGRRAHAWPQRGCFSPGSQPRPAPGFAPHAWLWQYRELRLPFVAPRPSIAVSHPPRSHLSFGHPVDRRYVDRPKRAFPLGCTQDQKALCSDWAGVHDSLRGADHTTPARAPRPVGGGGAGGSTFHATTNWASEASAKIGVDADAEMAPGTRLHLRLRGVDRRRSWRAGQRVSVL